MLGGWYGGGMDTQRLVRMGKGEEAFRWIKRSIATYAYNLLSKGWFCMDPVASFTLPLFLHLPHLNKNYDPLYLPYTHWNDDGHSHTEYRNLAPSKIRSSGPT